MNYSYDIVSESANKDIFSAKKYIFEMSLAFFAGIVYFHVLFG